jgi:hypothetical protein
MIPWMGHWPTTTYKGQQNTERHKHTYSLQQDVNLQPQCTGSPASYTITSLWSTLWKLSDTNSYGTDLCFLLSIEATVWKIEISGVYWNANHLDLNQNKPSIPQTTITIKVSSVNTRLQVSQLKVVMWNKLNQQLYKKS